MERIRYSFPKTLLEVHHRISQAGFQCYVVGGAVRNIVLKREPTDWDLATDAKPEEIIPLFRAVIPTGIKHGTVTVLYKGQKFEVTTYRIEGTYSDSRHPDQVFYTRELLEDLKRRDFTINAMAIEPQQGILVDPFQGREDCQAKVIRALGDPLERFQEDALRILRAVRFSCQLGFIIEPNTKEAMVQLAPSLQLVSAERVRDEMEKIMASQTPSLGFRVMAETGILKILFPELQACVGVEQKGAHRYDVFTHSLLCCDAVSPQNPVGRWAALLHDVGKPATRSVTPLGEIIFHGHEKKSAEMTQSILRRLRFPSAFEKRVTHLVAHHMFHYEEGWTDAAVRRFVRKVGKENLEDLFTLREADGYATAGTKTNPTPLTAFRKRIARVLSEQAPLSLKDLAVNGNDLFMEAGIPRGPAMGKVLEFLLESVIEDPKQNQKSVLITLARNYYNSRLRA